MHDLPVFMERVQKHNTMWTAIIAYENEIICNSCVLVDYKMYKNISQKRQRHTSYEVEDGVTLNGDTRLGCNTTSQKSAIFLQECRIVCSPMFSSYENVRL